MTGERHDIVVIGAGLAGLAAALELEAAGLDVLLLEGQSRVGGRVQSMQQLGSNKEAGGTYIGAGYRRVIGVAERYGVKLIDVTPMLAFFREQDLVLGDEIIRQSEWPGHPRNHFPDRDKALMPWNYYRTVTARENPLAGPEDWLEPRRQADYDIPFRVWLQAQGLDDDAIKLAYGINPSFGENAGDVSALLMLFRAAFSVAQRRRAPDGVVGYTAAEGMQRIPEAMASALRGDIRFDHVVTGIAAGGAGVDVRCANGNMFHGRYAVCTLPFGALREIAFDPELPADQLDAIRLLPSQPLTQLYFAFKSKFWEADGYAPSLFTDGPAGMLAAARNGDDPGDVTSFTAWAMGANALRLDALPAKEAGQRVIQHIERVRPAAAGQLEFLGLKSWGRDPFAHGAWAYFRPGEIRRYGADMGRPFGRLQFCGEHLGRSSRGMEAAMESAELAVGQILSAL